MGRLVESLAPDYGCQVVGIVTGHAGRERIARAAADVAVDFSLPGAVRANLGELALAGIDVVLGTTGWQAHEDELKALVSRSGIGVIASANFAIGMSIFQAIVQTAAARWAQQDAGAWIHEAHHAARRTRLRARR